MAIDLNRFIATFFDEAQEHLESIEEKAMALGSGSADTETLNSIFRAAHSIKGGSGTFGFGEMAAFTHHLESLLDKVRNGEIALTDDLVDLTLRAGDVLRRVLG